MTSLGRHFCMTADDEDNDDDDDENYSYMLVQ